MPKVASIGLSSYHCPSVVCCTKTYKYKLLSKHIGHLMGINNYWSKILNSKEPTPKSYFSAVGRSWRIVCLTVQCWSPTSLTTPNLSCQVKCQYLSLSVRSIPSPMDQSSSREAFFFFYFFFSFLVWSILVSLVIEECIPFPPFQNRFNSHRTGSDGFFFKSSIWWWCCSLSALKSHG